jgi:hypothetical protein
MFKRLAVILSLTACVSTPATEDEPMPVRDLCPQPTEAACKAICDARTIKVVTLLDKCRAELDEMDSRD